MFCKECGDQIESMHKFCPKCGNKNVSESQKVLPKKFNLKLVKNKFSLIALIGVVVIATGVYFYINFGQSIFSLQGVKYTKNPTKKTTPVESVVRIIVNKGTEEEASGSGLLFTEDGYILTNAHVVSSKLGKPEKEVEVCYLKNNKQETECGYKASVIDSDFGRDLAVIKTDKPISEIEPYLLVVEEDDEVFSEEILEVGSEIVSVGYPDTANSSITVTKGIVSGYIYETQPFYDASLHRLPQYIKTDTEINAGNSGGGAFDKDNRYIGIPSSVQIGSLGKLGNIIYWQTINRYLGGLVYSGDLKLNSKQFKAAKKPKSEEDLWNGVKAVAKEDYKIAEDNFKSYIDKNKKDSRGWFNLCTLYYDLDRYDELGRCAEDLRATNNEKALAMSWAYSSASNAWKETPDYVKGYDDINKALNINSENIDFMNFKSYIALQIDKTSEAEQINDEVKKIDSQNSLAWWLSGVIAESMSKTDDAIESYEFSFLLSPDADTASSLADLYRSTDNTEKELEYIVASLMLGSNDPNRLFRLSDMIVAYLSTYTEGESYITYLDDLSFIFNSLKIDSSLIEPIEAISDEDLTQYIKDAEQIDNVSEEKLEDYKFFIKMVSSWLYAIIEDKDMCNKFSFGSNNGEEVIKIHERLGFTLEEALTNVNFGLFMNCFCKLDDDSNDLINTCKANEEKTLCEEGKSLAGNGKCLTAKDACILDFGGNTYAKDDLCYCNDGYDWNASNTKCVPLCPANSYYSNGDCFCNAGYQKSSGQCVTNNKYCANTYGYNSYWSNNECQCNGSWKYYSWWTGPYCSIY